MAWILCLAGQAHHACAQTLAASVSRDRVYVGDQLLFNLVVTDARTSDRPQLDFPGDIAAEYVGQSQNSYTTTRRVGGQIQRVTVNNITHQYRITPLSPGTNTIPAATLTLPDGTVLNSGPVRFEALLPEPALDAPITIAAPGPTVYAGQSVEITVAWTMPDSVRNANFDTSQIPASL
ncbi:MAG: BatD family protein, partial [Planctomycetota bacterium]